MAKNLERWPRLFEVLWQCLDQMRVCTACLSIQFLDELHLPSFDLLSRGTPYGATRFKLEIITLLSLAYIAVERQLLFDAVVRALLLRVNVDVLTNCLRCHLQQFGHVHVFASLLGKPFFIISHPLLPRFDIVEEAPTTIHLRSAGRQKHFTLPTSGFWLVELYQ